MDRPRTSRLLVAAAVLCGLLAVPAFVIAPVLVVVASVPLVVGLVALTRGERRLGVGVAAFGLLLTLFGVAALVLLKPFQIPSESMAATIAVGDRVLVTRFGGGDPQIGDVVVFHPPAAAAGEAEGVAGTPCAVEPPEGAACPQPVAADAEASFISRVVARAGDRVSVVGGRVRLGGAPLDEPYVQATCEAGQPADFPTEIEIPAGHVFTMSDNRQCAEDSRFFGPVRVDAIVGTAVFRFRPLDRLGGLG